MVEIQKKTNNKMHPNQKKLKVTGEITQSYDEC